MFGDEVQRLRWFLLPSEALSFVLNKCIAPCEHRCAVSVRKKVVQLSREEILCRVKPPQNVVELYRKQLSNAFQRMELENHKHFAMRHEDLQKSDVESDALKICREKVSDLPVSECCLISSRSNVDTISFSSKKFQFVSPPKRLFKLTVEAIEEFNMIENNDKVLVCLSGGKVKNDYSVKHKRRCCAATSVLRSVIDNSNQNVFAVLVYA